MIHCLVLEDEKAAQDIILAYITKTPFMRCIGIYESGLDIPSNEMEKADILFLDIQLPGINGLSYLHSLINPPKIIVTTAYSKYAVNAFEENVLDYLVKPFSYERFFKAVSRAKNEVEIMLKDTNKQLFVYADKTIFKINTLDILFLKAEVDYVKIFTTEKSILVLDSLTNWQNKLEDLHFVRTHRSYIVNTEKIKKIIGNRVYILDNVIPIGKTYKEEFFKQIGYGG